MVDMSSLGCGDAPPKNPAGTSILEMPTRRAAMPSAFLISISAGRLFSPADSEVKTRSTSGDLKGATRNSASTSLLVERLASWSV